MIRALAHRLNPRRMANPQKKTGRARRPVPSVQTVDQPLGAVAAAAGLAVPAAAGAAAVVAAAGAAVVAAAGVLVAAGAGAMVAELEAAGACSLDS